MRIIAALSILCLVDLNGTEHRLKPDDVASLTPNFSLKHKTTGGPPEVWPPMKQDVTCRFPSGNPRPSDYEEVEVSVTVGVRGAPSFRTRAALSDIEDALDKLAGETPKPRDKARLTRDVDAEVTPADEEFPLEGDGPAAAPRADKRRTRKPKR